MGANIFIVMRADYLTNKKAPVLGAFCSFSFSLVAATHKQHDIIQ